MVVLTPPPQESIPTWREPPLLGRSNADNETDKQAEARGHGCRFKLTEHPKVHKSLQSFRLLTPSTPSSRRLTVSQLATEITRCFTVQREAQREHSGQQDPGPSQNSCSQWRPCSSWVTGLTVTQSAIVALYQPITSGQMERCGCGGVSEFSTSLELQKVYSKTRESERVPRVTHSSGGSGVPEDIGEIQTFLKNHLPYK